MCMACSLEPSWRVALFKQSGDRCSMTARKLRLQSSIDPISQLDTACLK